MFSPEDSNQLCMFSPENSNLNVYVFTVEKSAGSQASVHSTLRRPYGVPGGEKVTSQAEVAGEG